MRIQLWRRAVAEFVGAGLLVTVVVGSGIAAQTLSPDDVGLQLLENSVTTALGLAVLILVFGPVSGGHLNPVVSMVDWWLGRRTGAGLSGRELAAYLPAQVTGGVAGAVLANLMYALPAVELSGNERATGHLWLGEVVATAGLVLLVFSLVAGGRTALAPAAVGAYIGAAYWFTSSTSFANPAVTVGRAFTDTFAGIAPASVPGFVVAQAAGGLAGIALFLTLYPYPRTEAVPVKPSVLFVCVHNAGRSQMAAAWLRHLAGDRVEVRSAGSDPAERVNPVAVAAMREVGIDIGGETPKKLDYDTAYASDVIVTMGCGDACPVFPGKQYQDWQLDDPAGQGIDTVRRIRDEIRGRVEKLLAEVLANT